MAVVIDQLEVVTGRQQPDEREQGAGASSPNAPRPPAIAEEIERSARRRAERLARLEAS